MNGGRSLIAVQSDAGKLFRIDLDPDSPGGRRIVEIVTNEPIYGDGLLLEGRRLTVVTFDEPGLALVRLNADATAGLLEARLSDPSFRGPSTVARARNYYLVVNADFSEGRTPFTVTATPAHRE